VAKPRVIRVTKADNNFQYLEVISRNRRKRHRYGVFLVETVKGINAALQYRWDIQAFIYPAQVELSRWAQDILQNSRAPVHYELNPRLMEELSDREETSELLALAAIPPDDLARIPIRKGFLMVVLDRPSNPGNIGTIIRSCDSFQAAGLVITGHSADLYDPQAVRSSISSLFALPTVRVPSYQELLPWFARIRERYPDFQIIGSSAKATKKITQVDFTRPTALILGNETSGLSHNFREICDEIAKIPIFGSTSSLNIACAASIFLYEIQRQRCAAPLIPGE